MPSYVFSDYGDFLRTGANKGDEDDRDLDRVEFDMDIFRAFTEGYLAGAGAFLTPVEIENLPYAAAMFPTRSWASRCRDQSHTAYAPARQTSCY